MEAFLLSIGFVSCVIAIGIAVIKAIEAVWFFKEFRESVTKSLTKIEERLNNLKP
jgi:hypothetical protein